VTNQGAPIPEKIRGSLFLPFSRGETTSLQGLGLGLYIAYEIAKAHGGRIGVESDEKNGTTFALTMPARYD
jgi:signal transduction histidine kinase